MLIKNWVTWVTTEQDYLIGSIDIPNMQLQDNFIYQYNQGASKHCTLYSAMGCLSDLFNYKFNSKEKNEIIAKSYKMGRTKGNGWITSLAFNCVRRYRNEKYPEKQVMYFKVPIQSKEFLEAISLWYSIWATYKGNADYNNDFKDDGIVQGTEFGDSTYWHAIRLKKRKNKEDYNVKVIDNYKGREYNIYEIPDISELVKSWVFYSNSYIFVPEEKVTKTKWQILLDKQLEKAKANNSLAWRLLDKLKQDHEVDFEKAELLQKHLSECNSVIRRFDE